MSYLNNIIYLSFSGAIFFDTEMHLAEAFDTVVEEVNAQSSDLQLEPIKHYITVDDSIVLQDLCE